MDKTIYATVTPKGFSPASPYDHDLMCEYPFNAEVKLVVTRPRSVRENSFYWVCLQNLIDAGAADFPNPEMMHNAIKLELGYVKAIKTLDGAAHFIPDSTDFNTMDQAEFNHFMKRADKLLIEAYGKGFDELKKERAA
jgi:hypothetical protein